MNIDTNKMVGILKSEKPLSVISVEEHDKTKLVCLFALPQLSDKIIEFANSILKEYE